MYNDDGPKSFSARHVELPHNTRIYITLSYAHTLLQCKSVSSYMRTRVRKNCVVLLCILFIRRDTAWIRMAYDDHFVVCRECARYRVIGIRMAEATVGWWVQIENLLWCVHQRAGCRFLTFFFGFWFFNINGFEEGKVLCI